MAVFGNHAEVSRRKLDRGCLLSGHAGCPATGSVPPGYPICFWMHPIRWLLLFLFLPLLLDPIQAQPSPREFPPGALRAIEDLPPSALRSQLERLPGSAQSRALSWLQRFHFTVEDLSSIHADSEGALYYADSFAGDPTAEPSSSEPMTSSISVPISPFPAGLKFHSRPGAANVIFLNFAGDSISGTAWNTSLNRTIIPAVAFSTDTDFTTFSDAEQLAIKRIWQRVSEDYAPFDVDVTTERPSTFTTRTAHALITRNTDVNGDPNPSSTSGGVAYVSVFASASYANYRPAWVYFNNLGQNESYIAEAASHELGHNFGLSHDGVTGGTEYYGGHGSGDTSWGTIMGTGYNRNVSQWSKGDYYQANNTQDDFAVISGKMAYRPDDHGNAIASATPLTLQYGTNISSTTPDTDPANTNRANKGVLERNTDMDVFSFVTGTGPVNLSINPWIMTSTTTRGGNSDIQVELYSDSGARLLTTNPVSTTYSRIQINLTEGVYYLSIRGMGNGDPFSSTPTGYTSYGSVGQYFISGSVVPSGLIIPPKAQLQVADVTSPNAGANLLTVTYSDNAAISRSTVDANDIRVTGPRGYDRLARFVGSDTGSNSPQVVASYAIDPPDNQHWVSLDNGVYTVGMQTNQVADIEGSWVAGGALGQFSVSVPTTIYSADMSTDPHWTLEPLWQYGSAGGEPGGPSSGFTGSKIIGYNLPGDYENNLAPKYATTPPINCSGASLVTLRFQRWLRMRNGDTASIQVSTNGIGWDDLWSSSRSVTDSAWQDMQYILPAWAAGSPSVQLRWGLTSGPSQSDIGWNIDDVQLLAGGPLDTTPPSASVAVADVLSTGVSNLSIRVNYVDDSAIRVGTIGTGDILVTGPNSFSNVVELAGVDLLTDGTPRTATYSLNAPLGFWQATDNGVYLVTLLPDEVTDTYGNTLSVANLASFTVNVPTTQPTILVETTSIGVPEGGTASFNIHLAAQPASPVTLTVTRIDGDADLVVQSGSTLQFDASNWAEPRSVTIAASPDLDQLDGTAVFECQGSGLIPVTINVTEIDTTPDAAALSVNINQPAWGTVFPTSGVYTVGAKLELLATPAPYFRFAGWSGGISDTSNPLSIVLETNLVIEAIFSEELTTNHPTPLWWLVQAGYSADFESAVEDIGANGVLVWESYVAGLNPADPESQLKVSLASTPDGTSSVLNWTPVAGRIYSIETTTTLEGRFETLPGATNLINGSFTITNSLATPTSSIFYRIKVQKP